MPNEQSGLSIPLPCSVLPVLALGAWFKNSLCLVSGNQAWLSDCIGDLDCAEHCRTHEQMARELLQRMATPPKLIAHDLHPDFHSSRFAATLAYELNVPLIAVQHHHAHIAAVCCEHGWHKPVLGLALDGVGLGTDGTAWGGELLLVNGAKFHRLGHLVPLPLPGGDRAAQEPWRMAAAALHELGRNREINSRFADEAAANTVATMLEKSLNCPRTSSMGRVFDAAAGLLGLCHTMHHEAEAAIALEQAATRYIAQSGWPAPLPDAYVIEEENDLLILKLLPLLDYLAEEKQAELGAAVFHATLATALVDWVARVAEQHGIPTVACGGGCFFNHLLRERLPSLLAQKNITALLPQRVSPGDSAISLGQAWVAAQSLIEPSHKFPLSCVTCQLPE
ncbi:MAG: carbamoyltransferase HypF [Gallionella sp.]|nr:carbamoyltransferase HypF [Gallionella sp.]